MDSSLNPKFSNSDVVNQLKGKSSHWINSNKMAASHFAFKRGQKIPEGIEHYPDFGFKKKFI